MLTWLRKNMKAIMITVAVVFAASMFYGLGYRGLGGGAGPTGKSSILAKVNGREVDPFRYRQILGRLSMNFGAAINPQEIAMVENMALGQAIDFTMLLNEAKKKVKVPGREVDAALQGIMQQQKIPSKRDLDTALKRMGLNMGKFRETIKDEISVQKLLTKVQEEVRLTPDDMREVRASHILLSQESAAKTVLNQVRKGDDFSALAKQYSLDKGSAAQGGDLGFFATGAMVEPFEQAAFSMKVGQVSNIVKSPFGYHIIKVTDSRLRKFPGDEKVIQQTALKEKRDKVFRKWYSEIRSKAKIEIISPELKGNDYRFKGQLPQALAEYKKALAQDPTNPLLHVFIGDTYMAMGQKPLALAEYENAVRVEGGNPNLYIILGKAYENAGENNLAAGQYAKASLIAGDNKPMHEQLLKLFQTMKRSKEVSHEKAEIKRLEKKEQFEKELTGGK